MQGIESATSGLSSPNMTADTFEALAILYRNGARRTPSAPPTQTAKIVADMPIIDRGNQPAKVESPKEDWLQPKIFKSGSSSK